MVTALTSYNNRIVRKGIIHVTEKETNRILVAPTPSSFTIENGFGGKTDITEVDNQGYETNVGLSFGERKARVSLTFSGRNLTLTALQMNRKTEELTLDLRFPYGQQVLKSLYAAAPTGKLGFGIVEDAVTRGSYQDPETQESILLTQQPFATFNAATPLSFAVGDNFARKFSDDVVAGNFWVRLAPLAEYTARAISEEEFGYLELNGICFNSNGRVSLLKVDTCFIDPEGSGVNADGNVQINFNVPALTTCQPWNEYELPVDSFCEN